MRIFLELFAGKSPLLAGHVGERAPQFSFSAVSKIEANEETALLVYLLVYRNDQFRSYILSLTEPESLVRALESENITGCSYPKLSPLCVVFSFFLCSKQSIELSATIHRIRISTCYSLFCFC